MPKAFLVWSLVILIGRVSFRATYLVYQPILDYTLASRIFFLDVRLYKKSWEGWPKELCGFPGTHMKLSLMCLVLLPKSSSQMYILLTAQPHIIWGTLYLSLTISLQQNALETDGMQPVCSQECIFHRKGLGKTYLLMYSACVQLRPSFLRHHFALAVSAVSFAALFMR